MKKAIILAAGAGRRLAEETPKPLLPLNGQPAGPTFLDWHIACLRRAGVGLIYIVGNERTFNARLLSPGPDVRWILNPTLDMACSGSGHSAWLAFHDANQILDGRSQVILMDADIIYHPDVLVLASAENRRSATVVYPCFESTEEEVLVFGNQNLPRFHGKGLMQTPMVSGLQCYGEATGILVFREQDHQEILAIADWLIYFSTAKTRIEHEDISQKLMDCSRLSMLLLPEELEFMEADFAFEYHKIRDEIFPRLRAHLPQLS